MERGDRSAVNREFQGVPVSESETAHLQHLVYKAKFAEQISNDMRVPARIAFDENPRVRNDFVRSDSTELMLHNMRVPARITLSEETGGKDRLEKIDEFEKSVQLKTPPRSLNLRDEGTYSESNERPKSERTRNFKSETMSTDKSQSGETIDERYLTDTDPSRTLKNDFSKSDSMNLDTPEIAALVEILKPEDQNSRVVRQQFFRLFRRITRLEKRETELQESLDSHRKITYASIGLAVLAIGLSITSSQRSLY